MKFQGLVLITLASLSTSLFAQNQTAAPAQTFLPPAPARPDTGGEPKPLPPTNPAASEAVNSIEAELKKFRSELRDFQALREEMSRDTKDAEQESERSLLEERQELVELLTKLAKSRVTRKPAPVAPKAQPELDDLESENSVEPSPTDPQLGQPPSASFANDTANLDPSVDAADSFALGKVLFRNNDFVGAEKAFRHATVAPENQMTLKYLLATCLRRQSNWKQAMDGYKEVAESNQDPVLRDLAKWQLENIRWHQQSETQLEQLRKQREKKLGPTTDPKPNANAKVRKAASNPTRQ